MAAGHQRLLVGRRHDLPGTQRGEHRAEADHAAGADDDEVDVVACREGLERIRPADPFRPGRQVQAGQRRAIGERDRDRPQARRLVGHETGIGARGERHDAERVRMGREHVDRLAADRAGRAEECDAARSIPCPARLSR